MNVETVREYCLNKKGVTESFPFDDVSLVVKVMNKMFALIDLDDKLMIELIDHSYDEVIKKFTKKLRAEYDALP